MTSETNYRVKALAAAVFWGASFVGTKLALREVHPITIIVLRFAIGVLVLALAVIRLRLFKWVGARDFLLLCILGAISVAVHQGLQATGLELTSASSMAWLVALTPVFSAILAWLVLSERFGPVKVLGLVIAFVGAVTVVTKGVFTTETLHLPSTAGDLLAMASAFNWAIFSVSSKPLLKRLPPTLMMAYVMLLGWLLTLPFWVIGQNWKEIGLLTSTGWLAIAFLGFVCSGLCYIFWYDALSKIDASEVAAFIYIEPLVTVVVASMIIGESFTISSVVGGLTILVGVYLVNASGQASSVVPAALALRIRTLFNR